MPPSHDPIHSRARYQTRDSLYAPESVGWSDSQLANPKTVYWDSPFPSHQTPFPSPPTPNTHTCLGSSLASSPTQVLASPHGPEWNGMPPPPPKLLVTTYLFNSNHFLVCQSHHIWIIMIKPASENTTQGWTATNYSNTANSQTHHASKLQLCHNVCQLTHFT